MDTKIVSKELIKPSTPTPQNLNNYKLSFIDELSPQFEFGVLLFYAASNNRSTLKESLANVLVKFYPLAGRYMRKHLSVDCSDQGAEFVEAEATDIELNDVIVESDLKKLSGFVPFKNYQAGEDIVPVLSVQVTGLKCGGDVIGISVLHRVFDASSLGAFVAAWSQESSSIPAGGKITGINPNFDGRTLFACKNRISDVEWSSPIAPKPIVKRFSFSNQAIASLRSNLIASEGKKGISRVQVVCAVIAKALFGVDRAKNGGKSRPSLIVQAVNIRERTIPPLPKHACGNLLIMSSTDVSETEETSIQQLVSNTIIRIKGTMDARRMDDGGDKAAEARIPLGFLR